MNRRGAALLVVLLALLLLGALSAAALTLAQGRLHAGRRLDGAGRLRVLSASHVDRLAVRWDVARMDSLPIGGAAEVAVMAARPGTTVKDSVLRLAGAIFEVRSVAEERSPAGSVVARAAMARLIRSLVPVVPDSAAIFAAGPVAVLDRAKVDGTDHSPATAVLGCLGQGTPPPGPGVVVGAGVTLSVAPGATVGGSSGVIVDSAIGPGFPSRLRPVGSSDLAQAADQVLAATGAVIGPTLVGGQCDGRDSLNWGDPLGLVGACAAYLPVIHIPSLARLDRGRGQGVLIAAGPLELAGGFYYEGVVLAEHAVVLRDSSVIVGVLLAGDSVTVEGGAGVVRSVCAVARAVAAARRGSVAIPRGWSRPF